ncbi:hypothetical protein I350_00234 [Cryptococcus amylolentus CBS 6273]|uniref:Uncharacterized protein n=1 Tax=Cryptococcus amylolentus CBS 6273 TaxID=1296118 RepID=A0A1E3KEC7_9TREE|nr:hypothetical protein I350_00234 [Cryptococcus amylolentus CBS 6273]
MYQMTFSVPMDQMAISTPQTSIVRVRGHVQSLGMHDPDRALNMARPGFLRARWFHLLNNTSQFVNIIHPTRHCLDHDPVVDLPDGEKKECGYQDDGDSQAPPILQPYHDLERWTYNENHTWPHRPEDEERAEQVDWIKLQSDNDCNRSMMVVKEEPVDGSEIDQDRRTAFQKLGLTVRREEPISYNLIQEITLPVPCPPEAEDGEEERTSVSKVFIWDHLEGEHNPYGCGSSICEGYAYDDPYAPPEFEEPSEGACKPYQKYAPESIADVFDMLCRREAFAEVDTGLPPDAPLKEVSIKVATFNAKSDLSMGIGVLKEEELTRIHHETCGTEFCAGSRTEEEARNELVEPAYRGDKCRPDVWYIFEPEDGVSHRHSRLDLYGEASQLDVLRAQGVELGGYGEFEEPETPEGSEPASPVELEEPGEPEESGLASPEEFEEPVEPDPGTPEEQEEQEGSEEFEEEE